MVHQTNVHVIRREDDEPCTRPLDVSARVVIDNTPVDIWVDCPRCEFVRNLGQHVTSAVVRSAQAEHDSRARHPSSRGRR